MRRGGRKRGRRKRGRETSDEEAMNGSEWCQNWADGWALMEEGNKGTGSQQEDSERRERRTEIGRRKEGRRYQVVGGEILNIN